MNFKLPTISLDFPMPRFEFSIPPFSIPPIPMFTPPRLMIDVDDQALLRELQDSVDALAIPEHIRDLAYGLYVTGFRIVLEENLRADIPAPAMRVEEGTLDPERRAVLSDWFEEQGAENIAITIQMGPRKLVLPLLERIASVSFFGFGHMRQDRGGLGLVRRDR